MNFRVIKEDDIFYLSNLSGDSPLVDGRVRESGLFTRDTRVLSRLEWSTNPDALVLLDVDSQDGFECRYRFTNRPPVDGSSIPRESILVTRNQRVDGSLFIESGAIENYSAEDVHIDIAYVVDADFADMFEVRGFQGAEGRKVTSTRNDLSCQFQYVASDRRTATTTVSLCQCEGGAGGGSSRPMYGTWQSVGGTAQQCTLALNIPPRSSVQWMLRVTPELTAGDHITNTDSALHYVTENVLENPNNARDDAPYDMQDDTRQAASRIESYRTWFERMPRVKGHTQFAAWYQQGLKDIRMLLTDLGHGPFLTAGVPWYAVPFGRDSLIAARQMLLASPEVARGTLATLAQFQGKEVNAYRDEQPGKILHEMRDGELSRLGILPFSPYFGSVDSTPLFLVVLADYYRWTGDVDFVSGLLPQVQRAFEWIEQYGDRDGDGFVEYWREADGGIANQGWKDSGDSVMHMDGRLAEGPIALAEVQGYVYMAYMAWSRIYGDFGDQMHSAQLRARAESMKAAFVQAFYLPQEGIIALALDGEKRPLAVASSNMGQVLISRILPDDIAGQIATRVMKDDMFTGYGVRTLSSREVGYNPLSYHNGSVWPHDTSLILNGLTNYGAWQLADRLISGLLDAQEAFEHHRLPELFGGFSTKEAARPVPYPVSCSPQAWAAAVPVFVLEQILGIQPDVPHGRVGISPHLPDGFAELTVEHIPLARGAFSIALRQSSDGVQMEILANTTGLTMTVPSRGE